MLCFSVIPKSIFTEKGSIASLASYIQEFNPPLSIERECEYSRLVF